MKNGLSVLKIQIFGTYPSMNALFGFLFKIPSNCIRSFQNIGKFEAKPVLSIEAGFSY
jgi:hypothetical protein